VSKKSAIRRPAVKPEPVIITTEDESQEPQERIPVFTLDDVEYTMPAHIPASMSLRVLDMIRRVGQEAAVSWVLEEVLGDEAYQALLNCRSLKPSQLLAVMAVVQDHVLGAMEEAAGN
jgi:hypothetical protein